MKTYPQFQELVVVSVARDSGSLTVYAIVYVCGYTVAKYGVSSLEAVHGCRDRRIAEEELGTSTTGTRKQSLLYACPTSTNTQLWTSFHCPMVIPSMIQIVSVGQKHPPPRVALKTRGVTTAPIGDHGSKTVPPSAIPRQDFQKHDDDKLVLNFFIFDVIGPPMSIRPKAGSPSSKTALLRGAAARDDLPCYAHTTSF